VAGIVRVLNEYLGFDVEFPFANRGDYQQKEDSDANFRWRLNNYFNAIGMPYGWR
jgi:hypothetical protein